MAAILALETGQIFYGKSIGVTGIRVGELVFNTAMTGYQEIISDPSYTQQIITFTYPHIGNTGVKLSDSQANKVYAAGIVVKSFANFYSSWRADMSLQDYLSQQQVVGISDIDTRSITKILREHGALRACIMAGEIDPNYALQTARGFAGLNHRDLTGIVSCQTAYSLNPNGKMHVVLVDFGVKDNILGCLAKLDCKVSVVPALTRVIDIIKLKPQGILLSNGPGDPQACTQIIQHVKELLGLQIPIFGICLGHQILALALGAKTYKMDFGHHGANHPVQDLRNKKVLITSQNHGFAVEAKSLNADLQITHKSLFDGSLQGFKHKSLPIFGFQGHPEAAPGPQDALPLFAEFVATLGVEYAQAE